MSANRNKAGAPFQYTESLFAVLTVVKSMAGPQCGHLKGLESANNCSDSMPNHTTVMDRLNHFVDLFNHVSSEVSSLC